MGSLDLRAGQLDVQAYPGNEHTVTMTWPADALDGTTWSATLDGDAVDSITVDTDDLVLVFTAPATAGTYSLVVTQTDVTPDAVRIVGQVTATLRASSNQSSSSFSVTEGAATATVTVVGGVTSAALTAHTGDVANPHSVTKTQVGLGNVDNTSDANKPVSTAAQTALDLKAPLASPALTGTPTAPTQTASDNSTKIATTAYADAAVAAGSGTTAGLLSARPAASADNATDLYFATDVNGGTLYRSNGSSWVQTSPGVTESALRSSLWIPSQTFALGTGAPGRGIPNDTPAINLPNSGSVHAAIALIDPVHEHIDHWASFHIDVQLMHTSAESGIARIRTVTTPVQIGDGDTTASASGFTAANWTALGSGVVDDFRARSDVAITWEANKTLRLVVQRNPGGETGGIAATVSMLGVRLVQAS